MISSLKYFAAVLICAAMTFIPAQSQSLSDILKTAKGVAGDLTASSDFKIEDIAGTYDYNSPAVSLKGDNALKNIGGSAAATQLESKLAPLYERAGIDELKMTIGEDSTFSMKVKSISLNGVISKNDDGLTFTFDNLKRQPVNCIATRSGQNLSLCFDATKLIKVLDTVSSVVNLSSLNTIVSLLKSYDNLYIGFELTKTGDAQSADGNATTDTVSGGNASSTINTLLNRIKKK